MKTQVKNTEAAPTPAVVKPNAVKKEAICYVCKKPLSKHASGKFCERVVQTCRKCGLPLSGHAGRKWCANPKEKTRVVENLAVAKVHTKEAAIKGSVQFNSFDSKNLLEIFNVEESQRGEGFCVGNDCYTAWHTVDPTMKLVSSEGLICRDGKKLKVAFKRLGDDIAVCKEGKSKDADVFRGVQSIGYSPTSFLSGAQMRVYSRGRDFQGEVIGTQDRNRLDCTSERAFMTYNASTFPGMSGCPVFVDGHLVAIHIESVHDRMMNRGELLAPYLN